MKLDISILFGAVANGFDHRLDFPMEFFAVFTPEICLSRVNNKLHVLIIGFQYRVFKVKTCILIIFVIVSDRR
jgi:hypothetical protein